MFDRVWQITYDASGAATPRYERNLTIAVLPEPGVAWYADATPTTWPPLVDRDTAVARDGVGTGLTGWSASRCCQNSAIEREDVARWVRAYESAWRTAGTEALVDLFAPNIVYRPSPWARPLSGLAELSRFWEGARDGPDEVFELRSEVVALDGTVAVVRVSVDYEGLTSGHWRDLWVLHFDADGRCDEFEEWPFAPGQSDGHNTSS